MDQLFSCVVKFVSNYCILFLNNIQFKMASVTFYLIHFTFYHE